MEERRLLLAVALSLLVLTAYSSSFRPRPRPGARGRRQRRAVRERAGPAAPRLRPRRPRAGAAPPAAVAGAGAGRWRTTASGASRRRAPDVHRRLHEPRARGSCPGSSRAIADATGPAGGDGPDVPGGPRAAGPRDGRRRRRRAAAGGALPALGGGRRRWPPGETRAALRVRGGRARGEQEPALPGARLPGPGGGGGQAGGPAAARRRCSGARARQPDGRRDGGPGLPAPQACAHGRAGWSALPPEKIGPAARGRRTCVGRGREPLLRGALRAARRAGDGELRAIELPAGEDGRRSCAPVAAVAAGRAGRDARSCSWDPRTTRLLSRARPRPGRGRARGRLDRARSWSRSWRLLRWVHGQVGNYGWSIVSLTVLINLIMAPLRHYSIANGIKMAKLAPEMRVIQERYRKVPALDPKRQEMQEEIAGALRAPRHEHGHADAGGLPAAPAHHAVPDRLLPRAAGRRSSCAARPSSGSPT